MEFQGGTLDHVTTIANQNKHLLYDRTASWWELIILGGSLSGSNFGYNEDYMQGSLSVL